jgi:hypothetical protein
LSKYQSWDHEIPLKEGISLTVMPIYLLSERELEALRKYIDVMHAKTSGEDHINGISHVLFRL